MIKTLLTVCIAMLAAFALIPAEAQDFSTVTGKITDEKNAPIELVNVATLGYPFGSTTDAKGQYEIKIPADKEVFIDVSFVGFESQRFRMHLKPGEKKVLDVTLKLKSTELPSIEVKDDKIRTTNYVRIDPKEASLIPSITGGVTDIIKTLPGVSSNNELSSQYSVRGGNYDENMIYVNGIEIYRPFLIRSGQQEGLNFVFSEMVSSLVFSAGGFDAKYGDKMSSVLDISYKRPTEFGGSFQASLLGAQAYVEGLSKNNKFTYLAGIRYHSYDYILSAMETQGNYKPVYFDGQGIFEYKLSPKTELSFLGHYSSNAYNLVPETRETDFGTITEAYRLKIYFEGQEVDKYNTFTGALNLSHNPNPNTRLQFIASAFKTHESETYDILGQYWIGLLENALGAEDYGQVVAIQGVGSYLDHSRNYLDGTVVQAEHKGTLIKDRQLIQWGAEYQHDYFVNDMNEWSLIDSAGFSMPNPPTNLGGITYPLQPFNVDYAVRADNSIRSNRLSAFVQDSWNLDGPSQDMTLTFGLRASYWDYNKEVFFSPRGTFAYKPNWRKDIVFRLSGGLYYQPPFFKEMIDMDGVLHADVESQKSAQVVIGGDWQFRMWNRPFKFVTEMYYKYLWDLIPYVVDNVRIRYYGQNISKGYATGLEMKINGEFVPGIESWASLSVMKTMEDIEGDYYYNYFNESGELIIPGYTPDQTPVDSVMVDPGYIPRPTDQRVNIAIFFQDYLPKNPTFQIHLKLVFGSGLPFGAPDSPKYTHTLRYPEYRRVDIGFTKQLIGEYSRFKSSNPLRLIDNAWISLEVFNLLDISNTISYTWVSDVNGRQYAVPNYLTPRQINLKLIVDF